MNNRIIAVAGYRDSGKDTIAAHLISRGYERHAWADAIANVVAYKYNLPYQRLLGLTPEDRVWREQPHPNLSFYSEECGDVVQQTPRQALDYEGDSTRGFQPQTWMIKLLEKLTDDTKCYVVPGTRRLNEAKAILEKGGEVWYVERNGVKIDSSADAEVHLIKDLATQVIDNNGTLEDLARRVDALLPVVIPAQVIEDRWSSRSPIMLRHKQTGKTLYLMCASNAADFDYIAVPSLEPFSARKNWPTVIKASDYHIMDASLSVYQT